MLNGSLGWPELLGVLIIGAVLAAVWGTLFHKAGYSAWWAIGMFVPLLNLILILFLLFAEWPIQKELKELRKRHAAAEMIK